MTAYYMINGKRIGKKKLEDYLGEERLEKMTQEAREYQIEEGVPGEYASWEIGGKWDSKYDNGHGNYCLEIAVII